MTPGSIPSDPRRTTSTAADHIALFAFVDRQLAADLAAAERRGDDAEAHYLAQTLSIVDAIRDDLRTDPRRADEVGRFLCRTAVGYQRRPGFQGSWLLLA